MATNAAQTDALVMVAGNVVAKLLDQYLTAYELAKLEQILISTYGTGPYTISEKEIWTSIETQLRDLYAKRLSAKSSNLSQDDLSILRPLAYCQHLLGLSDAQEATLSTFISQGQVQYGSLTAFLAVPGQSPCPNILFGQHYYTVLMKHNNFAKAEEVIAAYIPVIEARVGRSDPRTLGGTRSMAIVLARQGKFEQAAAMERETWQRIDEMEGKNLPHKQDEVAAMREESKMIGGLAA